LLIAAALAQVLVLAYMAGEREWVLRTGRTIFLRTAPLDPRDVMRGDYVRLNYEISRLPRALCLGRLADTNPLAKPLPRDTRLYAALRVKADHPAELVSLSEQPPTQGPYLRGRFDALQGGTLSVRYGLEAYFMQQGKALPLEQGRNRAGVQVPLEMAVAVSSGGLGVLKGHRWSALGIGLDLETIEETSQPGNRRWRRPVAATVRLLNASSNELAVVDLPGGGSLALVPDTQWGDNPWRWAQAAVAPPAPQPAQVVVLQPGQVHAIRVDLNDARWSVFNEQWAASAKASPKTLARLDQDWAARFRFEYRPSEAETCQDLPNAGLIWHGRLTSRAFSPSGMGGLSSVSRDLVAEGEAGQDQDSAQRALRYCSVCGMGLQFLW
jgi:uncharacterized membrane-anchored protein